MSTTDAQPGVSRTLFDLYRTMVRIRAFETRVDELFLARRLPGFVHLYLGEEAVAAGVCSALRLSDYITSTHRGHGHAIAKGVSMRPLMSELYGKATGVCRGRGGSMHVADFALGMLGANGIVGGGFGLAAGAAMASQLAGDRRVAVCFFGDGGINKGSFHEVLNFASVRRLPAVFVCENNQYAQYTAREQTTSVKDLAVRAASYGIPGATFDGNDVTVVKAAATEAVQRARRGRGPSLLVFDTYRYGGHFVGDAEEYRPRTEVERQHKHDPIARARRLLLAEGFNRQRIGDVADDAGAEVEDAVNFAESSPYPDEATAADDVYASDAVT